MVQGDKRALIARARSASTLLLLKVRQWRGQRTVAFVPIDNVPRLRGEREPIFHLHGESWARNVLAGDRSDPALLLYDLCEVVVVRENFRIKEDLDGAQLRHRT